MSIMEPEVRLSVDLPARGLTLDDVAYLAAADELHRYELDEGNLLVMPPADSQHAALIMRIGGWFLANGYSPEVVLPTPGLRVFGQSTGRSPDLLVLRDQVPRSVWIEPADVLLAMEIVSPGSEKLDRVTKPAEYARAGIGRYWRVERDPGPATAHQYQLGTDEYGDRAYIGHRAILLDELLAGEPGRLG